MMWPRILLAVSVNLPPHAGEGGGSRKGAGSGIGAHVLTAPIRLRHLPPLRRGRETRALQSRTPSPACGGRWRQPEGGKLWNRRIRTNRPHPPSAPSPAARGEGKAEACNLEPFPRQAGGRWRQPEGGKLWNRRIRTNCPHPPTAPSPAAQGKGSWGAAMWNSSPAAQGKGSPSAAISNPSPARGRREDVIHAHSRPPQHQQRRCARDASRSCQSGERNQHAGTDDR